MYKEGATVNTYNDENVTHSIVTINKTTATTVLAANANRVAVYIYSVDAKLNYIREESASANNTKHGHTIALGRPFIRDSFLIGKGEISAITENTNNLDLYVTEITR